MTDGTLVTVAPTGAESAKADVPGLPVTVDEVVATARDCRAVGASVIHLHARGDDGRPTLDAGRCRELVAAVREAGDLVVRLSTGAARDPLDRRLAVLDAAPDAASLPLGEPESVVAELHAGMQQEGVVPVYEVSDLGHLAALHRLLDRHGPPSGGRVHVEFVMGVPGGLAGTTQALAACLPLLPPDAGFSATGLGPSSLPVLLAALSAGGHLRVGMADTLTYAAGQPVRDNAQLVARAAGLARIAQRPPLDAGQAHALLGTRRSPAPVTAPGRELS